MSSSFPLRVFNTLDTRMVEGFVSEHNLFWLKGKVKCFKTCCWSWQVVTGYGEPQGSCYHAILTWHFSLNTCRSLPALCLCQLLFLKVREPHIKTQFYMSLNPTVLSSQASGIINHLLKGANMLAYWGVQIRTWITSGRIGLPGVRMWSVGLFKFGFAEFSIE